MKLFRFGMHNDEKPGVVLEDNFYNVSNLTRDYTPEFFGQGGIEKLLVQQSFIQDQCPQIDNSQRFAAPLANPGKIICVGLNYYDHVKESGSEVPTEPILFSKAVTSLCGPSDNIEIPRSSTQTDWEVELAFVMLKKAKYIEQNPMDYVAGFCILNDVSEREFQAERCGQWVKGKSHDTFAPTGPFLVPKSDISDVQNLDMFLDVNGERMQSSNTKEMIFNVEFLVRYISQFMTLMPGDIISTGTPPGVGFGKNPKQFLKAGDQVVVGIQNLGEQKCNVIASP